MIQFAVLPPCATSSTPAAILLYAASGVDFMREWTDLMRAFDFVLDDPPTARLPGVIEEDRIAVAYGSARAMLDELRGSGTARPLAPATPLTPRRLAQVMAAFDEHHDATTTWHVLYGRLDAEITS